jgi:hypothetical protein
LHFAGASVLRAPINAKRDVPIGVSARRQASRADPWDG